MFKRYAGFLLLGLWLGSTAAWADDYATSFSTGTPSTGTRVTADIYIYNVTQETLQLKVNAVNPVNTFGIGASATLSAGENYRARGFGTTSGIYNVTGSATVISSSSTTTATCTGDVIFSDVPSRVNSVVTLVAYPAPSAPQGIRCEILSTVRPPIQRSGPPRRIQE